MGLFPWKDPFLPGEYRRKGSVTFTPENFQLKSTIVQRRLWVVYTHTQTRKRKSKGNLKRGRGIREAAKRDMASGKQCRRAWRQILPPSCTRKRTAVASRPLSSLSHQRASSSLCSPCHSTAPSSKYPFVSSLIMGKRSFSTCLTFLHGRKPHVSSQTQTQGPNPQTGNSLHKNHKVFCNVS
jgi:hypothetical protein